MRPSAFVEACVAWPAVLLLGACAARSGIGTPLADGECGPAAPAALADVRWENLAGSWRLTLLATAGSATGRRSVGSLSLQSQDAALLRFGASGNTTVPLYGTAELALEEVGAHSLGGLESASPASPGVALYVTDNGPRGIVAIARLGSGANTRDRYPFEGVYTALFIRRVDDGAFFGTWASSAGDGTGVSGHFCARRIAG